MNIAAESANINDVTTWINYGVLGLVVFGLLVGAFWTKPSVDKLLQERDRIIKEKELADAQRDAMARVLQEKLLPVVGDFIATTRALLPVLQQLQQLQAMIPILQEIIRTNEGTHAAPEKRRRPKRQP